MGLSKLLRHVRSGTLLPTSAKWMRSRIDAIRWRYGGYTVVPVSSAGSIKLYADSRLSELIRYGGFERTERTFVERFLRSGDIFVDVGANAGLYTILAAGIVGPIGHVLSFEPCRRTHARLVENVRRNKFQNVTLVCAALSNSRGSARLCLAPQEMDAWHSLATPINIENVESEEVITMTWDGYCAEHSFDRIVRLM